MSARAGTILRQFGYDQLGRAASVTVPQTGALQDDYVLGPGDEIVVSLRGQENNEFRATVDRNGQILLPRLNAISAAGRPLGAVRGDLLAAVHRSYVATEASISVARMRQISVLVSGEVNNPGEFVTVGPNLTLSQAIARAGGVRLSAARSGIFVIRRGPNDVPQAFRVEYMDVISGRKPQADVRLAQYDVVYVPRTGIFEVYTFWNQFVQQFVPVSWGFSNRFESPDAPTEGLATRPSRAPSRPRDRSVRANRDGERS